MIKGHMINHAQCPIPEALGRPIRRPRFLQWMAQNSLSLVFGTPTPDLWVPGDPKPYQRSLGFVCGPLLGRPQGLDWRRGSLG